MDIGSEKIFMGVWLGPEREIGLSGSHRVLVSGYRKREDIHGSLVKTWERDRLVWVAQGIG